MKLMLLVGGLAAVAPSCVSAQAAPIAAPVAPVIVAVSPAPVQAFAPAVALSSAPGLLPALTPVELEILTPASSRTSRIGEQVHLRLKSPVIVDGAVLIPAGVEGYAEVIEAARAGFGGRAGELVLGLPYLMVGTQRVDLKRLRTGNLSGKSNTGTAMVATAAVGMLGMLVSGGNIDLPAGTTVTAVVTRDTPLQPLAPAAVSSVGAVPTAAAATAAVTTAAATTTNTTNTITKGE